MTPKKVFVSGCYDLLHSGHVEFFRQAAQYGDLYVGIAVLMKPSCITRNTVPSILKKNDCSWSKPFAT